MFYNLKCAQLLTLLDLHFYLDFTDPYMFLQVDLPKSVPACKKYPGTPEKNTLCAPKTLWCTKNLSKTLIYTKSISVHQKASQCAKST